MTSGARRTPATKFSPLQEACAFLRMPEGTLRQWRHLGAGPGSFKIGRHVRYWRADLVLWLSEQTNRPQHHVRFGEMAALRVARLDLRQPWAAKAIGVPDLHPHQLRHTPASLAIASGADVEVVQQQMLGHSSATMTLDTYRKRRSGHRQRFRWSGPLFGLVPPTGFEPALPP
jgi:integrase